MKIRSGIVAHDARAVPSDVIRKTILLDAHMLNIAQSIDFWNAKKPTMFKTKLDAEKRAVKSCHVSIAP